MTLFILCTASTEPPAYEVDGIMARKTNAHVLFGFPWIWFDVSHPVPVLHIFSEYVCRKYDRIL